MRSEGKQLIEAIDEALNIGRTSGARIEISHLKTSGKDNWHKLDAALAKIEAARAEGIELVVISGFRTKAEQKELFFGVGQQRNQTPAQRAQVSAPPGYSEHHTGYAVDIGDGSTPSTNLSRSFEKTAAFLRLQKNAARYGFELSFPENNPQGVMYEPWHWRYVGDDQSLATFYKGQGLPPKN